MPSDPRPDPPADRRPTRAHRRRGLGRLGRAGDRRRRRRARGAPLPRILRRHHPQQEHPHGLLTRPSAGSSPGASSTRSASSPISSRCTSRPISRRLAEDFEKPTVKQHLAAIRMLFDWLVTGQVVATNPAHAVRGPKHVVKTGKTPVLDADEARELLDSIDTSTVVGLRDRALIGVMTYAFARIGAVVAMRVEDYYPQGQALVGPAARERRQAPRDAGAPQPRSLSRRLYRGGRHPRRPARLPSSAPPPAAPAR